MTFVLKTVSLLALFTLIIGCAGVPQGKPQRSITLIDTKYAPRHFTCEEIDLEIVKNEALIAEVDSGLVHFKRMKKYKMYIFNRRTTLARRRIDKNCQD